MEYSARRSPPVARSAIVPELEHLLTNPARSHSPESPHADGEPLDFVAVARKVLGEPEPLSLLRQEGVLRVLGWTIGRGRAECRQNGQLAHIVGVDIVLVTDGQYAVSERVATDGVDGLSRLDASCRLFETVAEAREYCEQMVEDETHVAARHAALDHATKRWAPFRGVRLRAEPMRLPFPLD